MVHENTLYHALDCDWMDRNFLTLKEVADDVDI